jgi:hypothetical protein
MVIGQDTESTDIDAPALAIQPDCASLRGLPLIQSPDVVVQRVMNVVMPLRQPVLPETMAGLKADLVMALARQRDALTTGLDNLGTIHFARFNIIGDALLLLSVYDGTLQGYVQEFAVQIGEAFDVIMSFVEEPPPLPVCQHPAEFVEWVMTRDIAQFSRDPTGLVRQALHVSADATPLEGRMKAVLTKFFENHHHAHLSMHRGYPGRSVAQIRRALEVGW